MAQPLDVKFRYLMGQVEKGAAKLEGVLTDLETDIGKATTISSVLSFMNAMKDYKSKIPHESYTRIMSRAMVALGVLSEEEKDAGQLQDIMVKASDYESEVESAAYKRFSKIATKRLSSLREKQ